MELYAVIMAGGVGTRFWPRSKEKSPKQLLNIFGNNTLIQDTVFRLNGLIKNENIFIVTNKMQMAQIKNQLDNIPAENIIAEPFGKNTAPCIGLASIIIKEKNPNAVTIVLPADHLIRDEERFKYKLEKAAAFAQSNGGLVTLGIVPDKPETGYGYIQFIEDEIEPEIHQVTTFAEKPNLETAKRFIEAGDFLWNSGIFVWRVDSILSEIQKRLPELYDGLMEINKAIGTEDYEKELVRVYGQLAKISIDYGVMEQAKNVYLLKGDFEWSDVGSWEAVYGLSEKDGNGNVKIGDVFTEKTKNSYIYSEDKFAAVIGMENAIVIETHDSILVCNRNNAQDVKEVVDYLKMKKKYELT